MNEQERRDYENTLSWVRGAARTRLVIDPDLDERQPLYVTVIVSNLPKERHADD